jgi:hypothetical protein
MKRAGLLRDRMNEFEDNWHVEYEKERQENYFIELGCLLIEAATAGDIEDVDEILQEETPPGSSFDTDIFAALTKAAEANHPSVVARLIKEIDDRPNLELTFEQTFYTARHAAIYGAYEAFKLFPAHGIRVESLIEILSELAAIKLPKKGQIEIVHHLLELDVPTGKRTPFTRSAFAHAKKVIKDRPENPIAIMIIDKTPKRTTAEAFLRWFSQTFQTPAA